MYLWTLEGRADSELGVGYQETPVGWDVSTAVEIGGDWGALTWHSFPLEDMEGLLHFSYKGSKDDRCL